MKKKIYVITTYKIAFEQGKGRDRPTYIKTDTVTHVILKLTTCFVVKAASLGLYFPDLIQRILKTCIGCVQAKGRWFMTLHTAGVMYRQKGPAYSICIGKRPCSDYLKWD